jgi:signal peptidase I
MRPAQNSSELSDKENVSFIDDFADMAESVIYAVFLVLLVFTFLFRIATVEGSSMVPTLEENDRLVVSNIMYEPKQGDIVIINSEKAHLFSDSSQTEVIETEGLEKRIVKRVIATEGQKLDIDFELGIVYIDDVQIYESYIADLTTYDEKAFEYPITIPEGYIFVMGDNRLRSKDSRHPDIGLVSKDDVVGHVILRISPFEKFGFVY